MTAVAAPGRGYQLQVGSPDALTVSVVMFPQQSVLALLRQVASGQPNGGPGWPPATIGRALRPTARFAAQSFTSRCSPIIPECCAPIPPLADVSVTEQADSLRDLPPDVLTDELHTGSDSHAFPRHWQAAADQPRRWLASLADASLDAWAAMQPRWRAAAPLLDREVTRAGTAAVRGSMDALLNSLHPRISYADGVLAASFPLDWRVELGGRRLVLMPMIANRGALAVSFERPDVCYIGYPIRPPAPGTQAAANGALALILGPLRAAALQALHHPLTVNALAAAVQCAPTTATYHLQQLATAGLVTRERHGTSVRVSRTTRGDKLIDLLSDLSRPNSRHTVIREHCRTLGPATTVPRPTRSQGRRALLRARFTQGDPGGRSGVALPSSTADSHPVIGTSDQPLPGPAPTTLPPPPTATATSAAHTGASPRWRTRGRNVEALPDERR